MTQVSIDLKALAENLGTNDSVDVLEFVSDLYDHLRKQNIDVSAWDKVERSANVQTRDGLPQIGGDRATIESATDAGKVRKALDAFRGGQDLGLRQLIVVSR